MIKFQKRKNKTSQHDFRFFHSILFFIIHWKESRQTIYWHHNSVLTPSMTKTIFTMKIHVAVEQPKKKMRKEEKKIHQLHKIFTAIRQWHWWFWFRRADVCQYIIDVLLVIWTISFLFLFIFFFSLRSLTYHESVWFLVCRAQLMCVRHVLRLFFSSFISFFFVKFSKIQFIW